MSRDPRYHTHRWRKLAQWVKRRDGYRCGKCGKTGTGRRGLVADHIIEVKDDDGRFWDTTNLQTLCWEHHAEKTWGVAADRLKPSSPNG